MIISSTIIITEAILQYRRISVYWTIHESQFFNTLKYIFVYYFKGRIFTMHGWLAAKMEERKSHQDHKKYRRYA